MTFNLNNMFTFKQICFVFECDQNLRIETFLVDLDVKISKCEENFLKDVDNFTTFLFYNYIMIECEFIIDIKILIKYIAILECNNYVAKHFLATLKKVMINMRNTLQ